MSHTIRYSSSRGEVWWHYWATWKTKLWPLHVLVAVVTSAVVGIVWATPNHVSFKLLTSIFGIALPVTIILFGSMPQILFKSAERTLTISPEGWSTQIGKLSGSRKWAEVDSIHEEKNLIIITGKNLNALIIPDRAFPDSTAKQQFLEDARHWHGDNNG